MNKFRLNLAFFIAPIFPALYMLFVAYIFGEGFSSKKEIFFIFLFSLPTSYISCLLIGAPSIRILDKIGLLCLVYLVLIAAALGGGIYYLFGYAFMIFLDSSMSGISPFEPLIWGSFFGVVVALPFSLIAGLPFLITKK